MLKTMLLLVIALVAVSVLSLPTTSYKSTHQCMHNAQKTIKEVCRFERNAWCHSEMVSISQDLCSPTGITNQELKKRCCP